MIEMYTEQELKEQLYTHWVNGVRVSNAHVMSARSLLGRAIHPKQRRLEVSKPGLL